ncbi:MAG: hypothetical protein IKJ69_01850 [Clostridia bacterium]|nr:hypothetical protein [Clostridia bacterium]
MDFSAFIHPPVPAFVVAGFLIAFILYIYIVKAINSKKTVEEPKIASPVVETKAPVAPSNAPGTSSGDLELVGVDEKTAAVIMAIVSDKSGIPLNRLQFKSIALMEDK